MFPIDPEDSRSRIMTVKRTELRTRNVMFVCWVLAATAAANAQQVPPINSSDTAFAAANCDLAFASLAASTTCCGLLKQPDKR